MHEMIRRNFERNVTKGPADECWIYPRLTKNGYGVVQAYDVIAPNKYKRFRQYAHRVSYELNVGPIPEEHLVCHSCDNRACVNPNHLFTGTDHDNQSDKVLKGRQTKGENHPRSKITEDVVRKLRSGELKPSRALARQLGLSESSHLYRIKSGAHWKYVRLTDQDNDVT